MSRENRGEDGLGTGELVSSTGGGGRDEEMARRVGFNNTAFHPIPHHPYTRTFDIRSQLYCICLCLCNYLCHCLRNSISLFYATLLYMTAYEAKYLFI